MDKKAQALDIAARRAIIKSQTQVDLEKRANFLKGLKNLFKPQAVGKTGVTVAKDTTKAFNMSPVGLLGVVAGAVIINQFIKNMIDVGRQMGVKLMEPKYYKEMLEENPQLLEAEEKNVIKLWSTLYRTSPHLASDPVAAGAFIAQNLQGGYVDDYGGPPIDTYKTLSGIEKDIQSNESGSAPDTAPLITGALTAGGFA